MIIMSLQAKSISKLVICTAKKSYFIHGSMKLSTHVGMTL